MKKFSKVITGLLILPFCLTVILSACGTEETHTWKAATCTEPKTCTDCGATEGEALGHTWQAATCTTPKTCSVCGATEGTAEHKWQKATCTEPKTCSVCGLTEGTALGHKGVGKCTNCNLDFLDTVCDYIQIIGEYDATDNEYSYVEIVPYESDRYIFSYNYDVQKEHLYIGVYHVDSGSHIDVAFTFMIGEVGTEYPWVLTDYSGSKVDAQMSGYLHTETITSNIKTLPYINYDSLYTSSDLILSFQKLAASFCKLALSFSELLLADIPEGITLYNLGFTAYY